MVDNHNRPERSWFRGDIDGLRAVAIVLVVAFHADIPGFSGGFIGVDVFFVISGYLITRNLVSEAGGSGTVGLVSFWSKRAKRLVPAMALMVVVTFVLSALVLSPIETTDLAVQGGSAVLYVSNIVFARVDQVYFAETGAASPFLHTWSLSVEEQFYLLWPVLVLVAYRFLRSRVHARRVLIGALVTGSIVSMAMNLVATRADSAWAFYSLPTRAWEFGLAGLLAVVSVPSALRRHSIQVVGAALGVVLLAYGTLTLSDDGGYPGVHALIPVVATMLLIFAGTDLGRRPPRFADVLSTAPMQWVGRVSYSWYLWHWPFIVLAVAWLDSDTVGVKVVAALVALPVAAVLYQWFERPIRFNATLARSPGRALGMAGAMSLVALLVAGVFAVRSDAQRRDEPYASLVAIRSEYGSYRCPVTETIGGVTDVCVDGDPDGERTVLLIGDSHARQWKDAFAQEAAASGVRVIPRWMGACPSLELTTRSKRTQGGLCSDYRADTLALIEELQPDAVVIANAYLYIEEGVLGPTGDLLGADEAAATWYQAFVDHVEAIRAAAPGTVVGRISDNPDMGGDPLACSSRPGNDTEDCVASREDALALGLPIRTAEDRAVADLGGLPTLATVDEICDESRCVFELDGVQVFADADHLTKAWTRTQAPAIGRLFAELGLT